MPQVQESILGQGTPATGGVTSCLGCGVPVQQPIRPQGGGSMRLRCPKCLDEQLLQRAGEAKRKWEERNWEDRPLCACGCGQRVQHALSAGRWSRYIIKHYRSPKGQGSISVQALDFSRETDAYILGVFLGDGSVSGSTFSIPVARADADYVTTLQATFNGFSLPLHVGQDKTGLYRLNTCRLNFVNQLRPFKTEGRWNVPTGIHLGGLLAGLIDTDGYVSKMGICIDQKANGNLRWLSKTLDEANLRHRFNTWTYSKKEFPGRLFSSDRIGFKGPSVLALSEIVSLRHPRKRAAMSALVEKIRSHRPKRLWGDLEALILATLPATQPEMEAKIGATSGNLDYKLLRMIEGDTVIRRRIPVVRQGRGPKSVYLYERALNA